MKEISVTLEQMHRLARYEITFRDVLKDIPPEAVVFHWEGVYRFTLEDLLCALQALAEKAPVISEFNDYWFWLIQDADTWFSLDEARGFSEDPIEDTALPEELREIQGLPIRESDRFDDIWWLLEEASEECEDEENLTEYLNLPEMIRSIQRFHEDRQHPIEAWNFTDDEKLRFISAFRNDSRVRDAALTELELCRTYTEEFCRKDNTEALELKGYACYGGNRLYPCDWKESQACIQKLYELTDNPQYANTLGYIAYYGRCSGGVPQYEDAFRYFSVAAANGLYEGMYKLADLYRHGYGCRKSQATARKLYEMVYTDCLNNYLEQDDSELADAALRMGNVYAQGIGVSVNYLRAWFYYLQADYFVRLRAEAISFFGDTTVSIGIQNAMDEIREKLPEDYLAEFQDYQVFPYLDTMLGNGHKLLLKRNIQSDGSCQLTAERLPYPGMEYAEPILATFPKISKVMRTTELTAEVREITELWFRDDRNEVRIDQMQYSYAEQCMELFYDGMLTARIGCGSYRVCADKRPELTGRSVRLAGIRFQPGGRIYDYLCGSLELSLAEHVIVSGYDGEQEVEVVRLREKDEAELALPLERYQRVIRKC